MGAHIHFPLSVQGSCLAWSCTGSVCAATLCKFDILSSARPYNFWKTDASTRWFGHCIIHKCLLGQILLKTVHFLNYFRAMGFSMTCHWTWLCPSVLQIWKCCLKRGSFHILSLWRTWLCWTLRAMASFWCETQDEFLNVSVAFNIWEPYLMSPLPEAFGKESYWPHEARRKLDVWKEKEWIYERH